MMTDPNNEMASPVPPPKPHDQDIAQIVEEYVVDAVVMVDASSRIIFWNRAAEKMFGVSRQETVGRDVHDLITPKTSWRRTRSGSDARISSNQNSEMDEVIKATATRKDGSQFSVELTLSPVEMEGRRCQVALVRDVARRIQLEEELHRLATTDPLTELWNRREFFARADQEIVRARRTQSQTSVFMMDLDRFKQLNDQHGHMAGDAALKAFATCLRNELRATDVVGRIGGEEFAVLLPDTPIKMAGDVANRLRARVEQVKVDGDKGPISFTVSIGVAQHQRGQESLENTMKRADKALYRAKDAGRNRVWVQTEDA